MSSTQQTITRLRELKLVPMADAYDMQLQQPKLHDVSFDDRFAMLVDYEASEREARKLKRLIRGAGMPEAASFEDVEYKVNRGLDKAQLASLASCDWIRRQQNLIIQGATGVGKTWLACAFGQQACRLKMPVLFYRASDLYGTINQSLLDGSLPALKLSLSKPSLLILDDLGLGEMNQHASQFLLDVIDRRMRMDHCSSQRSTQPTNGTDSSLTLLWLMPSWTAWCINPIGCLQSASPCAKQWLAKKCNLVN